MRAKEFMESVKQAEIELVMVSAKRNHYYDLMNSIGSKMSGVVVTTSQGSSKTETAAIGIYEMTKMLEEKEKEYVGLIKKAEELIAKLPQEKFRQVLTLKYLCRWSWRSIQDEMEYKDKKSAQRCNGYALRELEKVM